MLVEVSKGFLGKGILRMILELYDNSEKNSTENSMENFKETLMIITLLSEEFMGILKRVQNELSKWKYKMISKGCEF